VSDQEARLSLYRRWRPQRFGDIVDQTEIVRTLRNAVIAGEVSHAYLFSGERGIGKTSVARILARAVNCLDPQDGEPCNSCSHCTTVLANRSLDIVEIDGASNRGIDHIRRLREEVSFSPSDLKKKVYIIDEVHMLTNEAFNALLKTLEEPPPHAVFEFATTEPHKVPRTIVSRCQAFEFRKIPAALIAGRLAEVAEVEKASLTPEALDLIAQRANGGMRDALVMLEQAISYERDRITEDTVLDMLGLAGRETHEAFIAALEASDRSAALAMIDTLVDRGKDLDVFLSDVVHLVRNRLATNGTDRDIAIAKGLLEIKSNLFRALDRRVRLEIGVLDLMSNLGGGAQAAPASPRRTPAVSPVETLPASAGLDRSTTPPKDKASPSESKAASAASPDREGAPQTRMGDPKLDRTWTEMLEEVQRERIAIATFLTECRPVRKDGKIILLFHPSHSFHKESLEKPANLQYLAGVIHRHFGEEAFVELEYDPDVERKPTAREVLREKAELVRRMFDGQIVKEEL